MPTNRQKRTRSRADLKPWEYAFLTGQDDPTLEGINRGRLEFLRRYSDSFLLYGDRTARELLAEYPDIAKKYENERLKKKTEGLK